MPWVAGRAATAHGQLHSTTVTAPDPTEHEARLARRRHRLEVLRRLDVVAQRRALARRRAEQEEAEEDQQVDEPPRRRGTA